MKFSAVWAEVMNQNSVLRFTITGLSLATMTLAVAATKISLRDPIVVERSCQTSLKTPTNQNATPDEMKSFVLDAINMRFNTDVAPNAAWLAPEQMHQRNQEQEELTKKKLTQRIYIESIIFSKTDSKLTIRVTGDRIVAVGKIRSAFPFLMDVNIETTKRSAANPYGLVLTKIQVVQESLKTEGAYE